jgi:D-galactarolactone isomerase
MSLKINFPNACDCHVHIYDGIQALAPTATFDPPFAPVEKYQAVQQELGSTRVVVVQPTGYGFDNTCTLESISKLGSGARGIAVTKPDVSEEELMSLHRAGIRGIRFMMLPGGLLSWNSLSNIASKISLLGWNINLQLNGNEFPIYEHLLKDLPCKLVIDHIGKFLAPVAIDDAPFISLCRLLDAGRCWIKLSAPYESSRSGPPDYMDIKERTQYLARHYTNRILWASNWPHPNVKPEPSNTAMLNWTLQFLTQTQAQKSLLIDNPAEVYGYV